MEGSVFANANGPTSRRRGTALPGSRVADDPDRHAGLPVLHDLRRDRPLQVPRRADGCDFSQPARHRLNRLSHRVADHVGGLLVRKERGELVAQPTQFFSVDVDLNAADSRQAVSEQISSCSLRFSRSSTEMI